MHRRLIPHKQTHTIRHGNHSRKSHIIPASSIIKYGKSIIRVVSRPHDEQRNKDAEPSDHMQDEEDDFHRRQAGRKDGVEDEAEDHDDPAEQRTMPGLWHIGGVVEHREALSGSTGGEGDEG